MHGRKSACWRHLTQDELQAGTTHGESACRRHLTQDRLQAGETHGRKSARWRHLTQDELQAGTTHGKSARWRHLTLAGVARRCTQADWQEAMPPGTLVPRSASLTWQHPLAAGYAAPGAPSVPAPASSPQDPLVFATPLSLSPPAGHPALIALAFAKDARELSDACWPSGCCAGLLKRALRWGEVEGGAAGDFRCIVSIACVGSEKVEPDCRSSSLTCKQGGQKDRLHNIEPKPGLCPAATEKRNPFWVRNGLLGTPCTEPLFGFSPSQFLLRRGVSANSRWCQDESQVPHGGVSGNVKGVYTTTSSFSTSPVEEYFKQKDCWPLLLENQPLLKHTSQAASVGCMQQSNINRKQYDAPQQLDLAPWGLIAQLQPGTKTQH
eukprot:1140986-Pelagomonas_calceolata.AAC.3